ncbi:glycosyltransferase family 4 protein [Sinomonas sp. RB5]
MSMSAQEEGQPPGDRRRRIGLLYPAPDPLSPAVWSGTPHGLADGLAAQDVEVVPIGVRLPFGVHQAVALASYAGGQRGAVADRMPIRQIARTTVLGSQMRRKAPLDGVIAMGSEMYRLKRIVPEGTASATFDDGTLQQMWAHPDSDIRQSSFPERHVRLWIDRQAASSRAADVCCVSTAWAARSFEEDYGVPGERIRVVGIGHRPRSTQRDVRDWNRPQYLYVGVDWERKNGAAVVAAFRQVREHIPHALLHLVGRVPEIEEPGIVRHGFLPREDGRAQAILDDLYARATCFVLPSRFDPAGIAYLEAGSAGLPVIATTAGGPQDLIGKAGQLVDPHDVGSITQAMKDLAVAERARAAGAEAARVALRYSWTRVAGRVLAALAEAQTSRSGVDPALSREAR